MKQTNAKKTARLGILTLLALITFMIESLLPPLLFFAPGTKIGLASIFVTLAYLLYGKREALFVLLIKCILGGVFTGNMFSLMYSLPAGILSLFVSVLLYETVYPKLGVVAVSVIAAIIHNTVQITVAAIIMKTFMIMYYIPLAAAAGLFAGIVTGLCLYYIIRYIPKRYLFTE